MSNFQNSFQSVLDSVNQKVKEEKVIDAAKTTASSMIAELRNSPLSEKQNTERNALRDQLSRATELQEIVDIQDKLQSLVGEAKKALPAALETAQELPPLNLGDEFLSIFRKYNAPATTKDYTPAEAAASDEPAVSVNRSF